VVREPTRLSELARRPGVPLHALFDAAGMNESPELAESADVAFKYGGYLARERIAAAKLSEMEAFAIPDSLDYRTLNTLAFEAREKLGRLRPQTLGQASRVPGISPSDLQNLVLEITKLRRRDPGNLFHVKHRAG
jgi:tRNA uridine 5-carboxymethylaminomethyl modification enzyme